jgi:hypothetical protein
MSASPILTDELRAQLLSNGRNAGLDHVPVVKLFNPTGSAVWLATELDADGDTLSGLADLGMGCPELGSFSLAELSDLSLPFGLRIERDRYFRTDHPVSIWADAARVAGSIVAAAEILAAFEVSRGRT